MESLPNENDAWLELSPISADPNRWIAYVCIAFMVTTILATIVYLMHVDMVQTVRCERAGGVWVSKPGACVEPNHDG